MAWVQLTEACLRAGCSQNQLYRFGALRRVRTRKRPGRALEFSVADLDRVARERGVEPDATVRGRRTPPLAG